MTKANSLKSRFSAAAALAGLVLTLSLPSRLTAQNATWSEWQSLGDNVSISFSQVAGTSNWTWKFRNDGAQTISYMDFNYTDNTGQHSDILPGFLNPGQVIGGWAAFMSSSTPTVQLKTINYAGAASTTNGAATQQQNNGASSNLNQSSQTPNSQPPNAQQQQLPNSVQQHLAAAQAYQNAAAMFQADLSAYGKWMTLNGQTYWQPTEAAAGGDWRPYCTGGRWAYTDQGWAWDSDYNWGWAAFHYGRWTDDPVLGWIWQPDTVWAPAWVSWRGNDVYCGWAPLPPGAGYDIQLGFTFHGVTVTMDFNFGLGANDYCFINVSDMCAPNYAACLVPSAQTSAVYRQTANLKDTYRFRDGKIFNPGYDIGTVRRVTHRDIPPRSLAEPRYGIPAHKVGDGGALALHRLPVGEPRNGRPAANPRASDDILDDLIGSEKAARKPVDTARSARSNKAASVIDDLIADDHPQHEAVRKSSVLDDLIADNHPRGAAGSDSRSSSSVMDDLLSGGHGGSRTAGRSGIASNHSDDVIASLFSKGHTPPAAMPAMRPGGNVAFTVAPAANNGPQWRPPGQWNAGNTQPAQRNQQNQWNQNGFQLQQNFGQTQNDFQQRQDDQAAQRQADEQARRQQQEEALRQQEQQREEARQQAEARQREQDEARQQAEEARQRAQEEAAERARQRQEEQQKKKKP